MLRSTLIREITVVIAVAAALGVLYNAKYNPKPIPWVHEERKVEAVSDTTLGNILGEPSANTTPQPNTAVNTTTTTATHVAGIDPAEIEKHRKDSIKQWQKHLKDSLAKVQAAAGGATASNTNLGHTGAQLPPNNDRVITDKNEVKLPISVNYDQVLKLTKNPGVQFIDARKAAEFAQGHIANAFNMDMVEANSEAAGMNKIMQRAYQIPQDQPVVVYCGGGNCELSHELCDALIQRGLKKVFIYLGGWGEYSEKQGIKK